jgi:hypothetical protein
VSADLSQKESSMAITWTNTIKGYFTQTDVNHMKLVQPQLDLSDYTSTKDNAVLVYNRLIDKERPMPPKSTGGPWPQEKIDNFRKWIEAGTPE